jgi:glycosyltransferase involved in cell wall biosynthesis
MPPHTSINYGKKGNYAFLLRLLYFTYSYTVEFFDVWLLKKLKKAIVVTYQGDDARQGKRCKELFEISPVDALGEEYYNPKSDNMKKKRIEKFSRFADKIYALNPDLLYVLPASAQFLPYAHINLTDWKPKESDSSVKNRLPIVLHAPSSRKTKGTSYILEAVNQLQNEGIQFKFEIVEGVSNEEARRRYEKADLLIDQLFGGWYGGLSVELMALGKPVICYIRESELNLIPNGMREDLPIINATTKTIYEVLKYWLTTGKSELQEIGRNSRKYVEKWHDPKKIAARLKKDYEEILTQ